MRENIRLRRAFLLAAGAAPFGLVGSYLHTSPAPGLGRIAGLVALEADKPLSGEAAAAVQVRASGRRQAAWARRASFARRLLRLRSFILQPRARSLPVQRSPRFRRGESMRSRRRLKKAG